MLNIASRKFEVVIYKGDASPWNVTNLVSSEGISLTRQALTKESPPIVEGQLTLIGTGGESLNPRVNLSRFLPGNLVTIRIADSGGVLRDAPFGARLRINEFDFDDGRGKPGEGQKPPQITLMLTDRLGQAREAEPPTEPEEIEIGQDTAITEVIRQYLEEKQLTLETVSGDPSPTATTKAPIKFTGKDSVIEMSHQYLWCNPDTAAEARFLWVDNQERVRIGVANLAPTTAIFEVTADNLVLYKDIQEEKEKLPGKIKVTATGKLAKPTEDPQPQTTSVFDPAGYLISTTTTSHLTDDTNPQYLQKAVTRTTVTRSKDVFPDKTWLPAFITSERTVNVTWYNKATKRKDLETESTFQPRGLIDPEAEFPWFPVLARKSQTRFNYDQKSVLLSRQVWRQCARGLKQNAADEEDVNPYTLVTEGGECETYQQINADQYSRSNVSTDDQGQKSSTSYANAEALPPAADMMPEPFTIEDVPLEAEFEVDYPGVAAGTIKRTKTIELGEFALTQDHCQRVGEQYLKLVLGGWLAKDIVFPVPDTLLINGWPPGLAMFVARGDNTSDAFLCSGEVITIDQRTTHLGANGIWLGTRDTGALSQPPSGPVGIRTRYLTQENGDYILQETSDKIIVSEGSV